MRRSIVEKCLAGGLILLLTGCGSSTVTVTWTGSLSSPSTIPVGVRFVLTEDNGQLTGQTYFQDPVTGDYLVDDDVTGASNGTDATWTTTTTNLVAKGKFDKGGGFTGTLEFPAEYPLAIHVVDLVLHR